MKKLLAMLLAMILLLSALPFAGAAFKDEGFIAEEYRQAVIKMSEQGIINGFENGSFGPKKTLTRAQAAKILCVMLEGAEKANALTKTETGFSDVPATHWAAKFVAYCVEKGIVAGVGDGKFDPDGKLSSAAFAKMLLVAYGKGSDGFTGADWMKNVQTAADETMYLYNLGDKVTTGSMERQKAAQLAANALVQAGAEADKAKGDSRTYNATVPEKMRLYVIGNSYSNDCTIQYLYEMLKDVGVKDLVIGILYYSGCRYHQHADFIMQNKGVYKYYKNETGKFKTQTKVTFDHTLTDEDWTHIVVMGGGTSKEPMENEAGLWQDVVLAHVREQCPDAYFIYDMPWSYRTDGQHSETHQKRMEQYDNDSMKMYEGIKEAKDNLTKAEPRFKAVIPAGTAILNARSSFIGNGIHRDKISHLNKGVGRYIAAMATCCTLTGVTPDQIKYVPDLVKNAPAGVNKEAAGLQELLEKVARESVTNMLAKPFEVTQSQYKTAP
ncbi:MAG: DUF4886 domain-containing protein [Oscillospiraceae bacterium]|nr:DUF4886 domain-containing protein [Oscillospiraceae bacterium]MBR3849192.1 DUF4886 domain-containing protein [Oscillospiraceae bacterium]